MALTESTMLALGTQAPDFSLENVVSGGTTSLADVAGDTGTLVMFLCAHCPFVLHIQEALAALGRDYADSGVGVVGISSNSIETHPQDGPEGLAAQAREQGFTFPYLFDATQEVAKAYTAACTPDFFLFDGDRKLVYAGQFDGSRPGNDVPVTGTDLRGALDALIAGEAIAADQKPSAGCNIKWAPGNAPEYFG